jgi:hypothetical protein
MEGEGEGGKGHKGERKVISGYLVGVRVVLRWRGF